MQRFRKTTTKPMSKRIILKPATNTNQTKMGIASLAENLSPFITSPIPKPKPHTMKTLQTPAGKYKVPNSVIKTLERNQKWIDEEHPDTPAQAHSPLPKAHTMDCLSKGDASACPKCKRINDAAIERALEQMRGNVVPGLSVCIIAEAYDVLAAHAQRLADAIRESIRNEDESFIREALAQWNESRADPDALEALDQLEQLEGGE